MFDSHCHLQFNAYKSDREAVVKRCVEKGVICNVVGTQQDTSKAAVELAEKHDGLYATIGLHPIHTTHTEVDEEETSFQSREEVWDDAYYSELAKSKKVIAVGECGIELFHLPPDANKAEILKKQTEMFLQQINFAQKHNLPLVIHIRDAYDETINVLANLNPKRYTLNATIHCFSGTWSQAQQFLDMGFYLGFTGVVTFPPRKTNPQPTIDLLEVVKNCPLDRMLIETDAPYLAPQKYRGERCEPWMVEEVAKKIAEIKNISVEDMWRQVLENSQKLFGIKI